MPAPQRPVWIPPMLATLGPLPAGQGDRWAFEVKWDGLRAQAGTTFNGQVVVRSRSGADVTAGFPELHTSPPSLLGRAAVLDGELIVLDPATGRPDFHWAAARLHQAGYTAEVASRRRPVVFVAFDLLGLDGCRLLASRYVERRRRLEDLELGDETWQTTPAASCAGPLWEATAAYGLEGVVAKRTASRYQPGRRSRDWVKVKHWQTATLPIVGYLSRGERIAAVLVAAARPDGSLQLAGTVEWGLAAGWRAGLADALAALATPRCPLQPAPRIRGAVWVQPRLVLELRHLGWTGAGVLRQPIARAVRVAS